MADVTYLTKEGYTKLQSELEDLKSRGRAEIARAIAEAREKGDLSENAEYHAAKDEQGLLEMRINDLEKVLATARIIDESQLDLSKAVVMAKVTVKNMRNGMQATYQLVSESEADVKSGKISISSPIGEGLLGRKIGEIADVRTPGGLVQFEVLDISI